MAYTLTWFDSVVFLQFSGTVTGSDLLEANDELCSSPNIASIAVQVVDFETADKVRLTADAMRQVAYQDNCLAKKYPEMKVVVVAENPAAIGMTRMYEILAADSPWETRIFKTIKDAAEWVRLPDDLMQRED